MNKESIKSLDDLIKIAQAIQTLYIKLYDLELNNKKNSSTYNKIIETLKMSIDIEEEQYHQIINNRRLINNIVDYLNQCLPKLNLKDELDEKDMPLVRIYSHLSDLICSIEYQKAGYEEDDIKKIERYSNFNHFLNEHVCELYVEQVVKKENIFGSLRKFSSITKRKKYNRQHVIAHKYLDSYNFSFIESVLVTNGFDITDIKYPIMFSYLDSLMVYRESYEDFKTENRLSIIAETMIELLDDNLDNLAYLCNKAKLLYLIDELAINELIDFDDYFSATINNHLDSKIFDNNTINMIKNAIRKAYKEKEKKYLVKTIDLKKH